MLNKSSILDILLVVYLWKAFERPSVVIPCPLSLTWISWWPPFSITIVISVASASKLFYKSSLTTEAGLSTTSPAEILFRRSSDRDIIGFII